MVLDVPGSLSTPDGSPLERAKPWENPHKMVVEEEMRLFVTAWEQWQLQLKRINLTIYVDYTLQRLPPSCILPLRTAPFQPLNCKGYNDRWYVSKGGSIIHPQPCCEDYDPKVCLFRFAPCSTSPHLFELLQAQQTT